MSDDDKKQFAKSLRSAASKATFRVDEELAKLRSIYESLPDDDRRALKAWVSMVAETKKAMPEICAYTSLSLKIYEPTDGDEVGIAASVPVLLIPRAMENWDRGEHFAPSDMQSLRGS